MTYLIAKWTTILFGVFFIGIGFLMLTNPKRQGKFYEKQGVQILLIMPKSPCV
ncbi:MAG: hypothetical protein U5K51_17095 [Flavobacteriaceae bacterium]|nr:hypothetical protein [Flavobacteriaceae bacterium]